ncbi:hypothetical protein [Haloferax sulfurifontis]|uniref:hypothetical protein n=1 Tax=Haloferax sulfurifontis TaxID=255616 RepID=UPI0012693E4F|nr:hypothetical protein [Haloferax sulfurifontis]
MPTYCDCETDGVAGGDERLRTVSSSSLESVVRFSLGGLRGETIAKRVDETPAAFISPSVIHNLYMWVANIDTAWSSMIVAMKV